MKTNYHYYKNSNTGEIVVKQFFTDTKIKNMPTFWYDINGEPIDEPDLTGFLKISEKKFKLIKRKK